MSDAPEGFTTLHNPATGDPWSCPDAAVEGWEALGWSKAKPAKSAPAVKDVK